MICKFETSPVCNTYFLSLCRPHEIIDNPGLRINEAYYINKQILPALSRIFSLLGVNVIKWWVVVLFMMYWVLGLMELDVGWEFRDRGSIPSECQRHNSNLGLVNFTDIASVASYWMNNALLTGSPSLVCNSYCTVPVSYTHLTLPTIYSV